MNQALQHFEQHDPTLFKLWNLITEQKLAPIEVVAKPDNQLFADLAESIVSQQLSIKAADTIWKRVVALLPDQNIIPSGFLALDVEALRGAGLSRSKAQYVKNVAEAVTIGLVDLPQLHHLELEQAVEQLTQIKGVGRWTAEMFLMFSLGREDVFSVGDLGLRRAIERWYGVEPDHKDLKKYLEISQKWQPYRTYASRVLWRSLELPPQFTQKVL